MRKRFNHCVNTSLSDKCSSDNKDETFSETLSSFKCASLVTHKMSGSRFRKSIIGKIFANKDDSNDQQSKWMVVFPSGSFNYRYFIIGILVLGVNFFSSRLILDRVPNASDCQQSPFGNYTTTPERVCVDRAKAQLFNLTNFGPKPAGSYANEVKTVKILLSWLEDISSDSPGYVSFEYEVQEVTGMSYLYSTYYSQIKNVIARVSRKDKSTRNNTLLINSHFDSAKEGPGASDDEINVVVMLEALRSIVNNPDITLNRDIIFLFNGAEESGLLASHGFITQHRWADDVSAYINLEAVGSGGREMLFQSTSKELMRSYMKAAPYPFSNIVGQEIFQANIIPSDTDFRIFRDYGNTYEGGLDFAFIKNGYVYHTRHDTIDKIPDGSIQQAGDNLLNVVLDFVSKPIENRSSDDDLVFFDVFGLFMMSYSWNPTGIAVNISVAILTILIMIADIVLIYKVEGTKFWTFFVGFLICIASLLFIFVLSIGFSILMAYLLGENGLSMSWYTKNVNLLLLYTLPVLLMFHVTFFLIRIPIKKDNPVWSIIEILYFHNCNFWMAVASLILTAYHIKSGFLINVSLIFNILWWCVQRVSLYNTVRASFSSENSISQKSYKKQQWVSYFIYVAFQIVPSMIWGYIIMALLTVLVPTMGRNGMDDNPEFTISILMTFSTLILMYMFIPSLFNSSKHLSLVILLGTTFFISLVVLIATDASFPYKNDTTYPTTKRLTIMYTKRNFIDKFDDTSMEDAGYLTKKFDYHWSEKLLEAVPEYRTSHVINETECEIMTGCGYPQGKEGYLWTKADDLPTIPRENEVHLNIVSNEKVSMMYNNDTFYNVTMEMSGPNYRIIMMSPANGVEIISSGPGYFDIASTLSLTYLNSNIPQTLESFTFWLLIKGWNEAQRLMEAVIIGHYRQEDGVLKKGDNEFVDKHPDWVAPFSYVVDYKYYYF